MLTHFKTKKTYTTTCTPKKSIKKSKHIVSLGFSTFFVDFAVGILSMLFNIQIMTYLGSDALAVYGIIVNISIFVQCCAYGVGQASQPIFSANYSIGKWSRIKKLFRYNTLTIMIISLLWLFATLFFPTVFVHLYVTRILPLLKWGRNCHTSPYQLLSIMI